MKKRLTQQQEFEIMKLVLDKFLWLGFAVMAYGVWNMFTRTIHRRTHLDYCWCCSFDTADDAHC